MQNAKILKAVEEKKEMHAKITAILLFEIQLQGNQVNARKNSEK